MTRVLFDNGRARGRRGESSSGDGEFSSGRPSIASEEDAGRSRLRRPREDPSGRRSLTGLEFRRRRRI